MYRTKSLKAVGSPKSANGGPLPPLPTLLKDSAGVSVDVIQSPISISVASKASSSVANLTLNVSGNLQSPTNSISATPLAKTPSSLSSNVLTSTSPLAQTTIILRVLITSLSVTKSLRVNSADSVWVFKKMIIEKMNTDVKDVLNFGIFVPPKSPASRGHFLDDMSTIENCGLEANSQVEFSLRRRILPPTLDKVTDSEALPTQKNQKRFVEDVTKGNVEKLKDRCAKGFDPNFETEAGDTPLCAAILLDDVEIIIVLLENGASMDYRCSDKHHGRAALHVAVANNKISAFRCLIQKGAWIEIPDAFGQTPMYYAVSSGNHECAARLLELKAEVSYVDESGKTLLHMACLNNSGILTGLLIDYGYLDMEAVNVAGNTPLHLTATRNAVESAQRLLIRGADRDKTNKFGNTALQMAILSGSSEVAELLKSFSLDQIVPPPPQWSPESTPILRKKSLKSITDSETTTEKNAITTSPSKESINYKKNILSSTQKIPPPPSFPPPPSILPPPPLSKKASISTPTAVITSNTYVPIAIPRTRQQSIRPISYSPTTQQQNQGARVAGGGGTIATAGAAGGEIGCGVGRRMSGAAESIRSSSVSGPTSHQQSSVYSSSMLNSIFTQSSMTRPVSENNLVHSSSSFTNPVSGNGGGSGDGGGLGGELKSGRRPSDAQSLMPQNRHDQHASVIQVSIIANSDSNLNARGGGGNSVAGKRQEFGASIVGGLEAFPPTLASSFQLGQVDVMVEAVSRLKELAQTGLLSHADEILAALDNLSVKCKALENDIEIAVAKFSPP
ncbi:SH3 and multiple ankyrin repeat domains protein 2 [Physocladia obscura]|uniref:SH3 and multiple ankyrin repeat domains protein 2 n=1 Tax=Physocladia obscura TaxID=109957 RepID=A0AAD5XG08_9FUNG|nr:SH3 and multiple ankyrin repeat domains protein 2 [Physocladia obscura]